MSKLLTAAHHIEVSFELVLVVAGSISFTGALFVIKALS